ncbi:MAG: pyridoxal phosphate-dependent aminotransferase [Deltaproteobacteria bacterium]|jgi:cystathionine beta-lyase|nr:pyridoxal phosphate-dependent aminotransferase [Deltaproteobacteria bacterium]
MSQYDFDQIVSRANTNCIKYDFALERGMPPGLLPMWVADMDFRTPPEVIERLVEVARHGIFGYSEVKEDYYQSVVGWFERRFGHLFSTRSIVKTPGVVYALAIAVRALTEPGQPIVIQSPVYYPFFRTVQENGRRLVDNPLIYRAGRYQMDFEDLEKKIVSEGAKVLFLCSPHNPVSRVWTFEELETLGQICLKHHCLIVSDEIHCDFIFGQRKHHILTSVIKDLEELSLILTAPSKTFNLAGLQTSNVFISNAELRRKFKSEISRSGFSQLNALGLAACQSAYDHGEPWLTALLDYLEKNLALCRDFFKDRLAPLHLIETQGTYLIWIDFSPLGLSHDQVNKLVIEKAQLWLDEGTMFGATGALFQRMNIACPRSVLQEALERLEKALK